MVNFIIFICIIFSFFSASAVLYADVHTIFRDDKLICKASLPDDWEKTSRETKNKNVTYLKDKKGAEIIVTAYGLDINSKKYEILLKQYLKKTETFTKITKTRDLISEDGATYKILLFEFPARRKTLLQRTILIKQKGLFLIIECRAPVNIFGRYTELYDNVMASIEFSFKTKIVKSDKLEELQEDKITADYLHEDVPGWGVLEKSPALSGLSDEAKKVMKIEFKKIKELEKKGILERIE